MTTHILLTGGTIDKHYVQADGSMDFADSHIADILEQGRNRNDVIIDTIVFKDSLQMTDEDRELIANGCDTSISNKLLITHGTDTMVQTAAHIAEHFPNILKDKCIVLVGAMIPHEISYSDGTFNLGFALGALSALPNGIYIAMNGKIFEWDKVKKNLKLGEFEAI